MTKHTITLRRLGDRERERLIKLFGQLGNENEHEREAARGRIASLLRSFDKSWPDILPLFGGAHTAIRADIAGAIVGLGSSDPDIYADARRLLGELLARHRKNWNDLVDELCSITPAAWVSSASSADPERVNPLALIHHLLKEYVYLREHEYVAVALWALHTHVYRRFMVTPRLALRSPVPDCGKTTLMDILAKLVRVPAKFDSITAAALYHLIDETHPTLLIDEVDNLLLGAQPQGKLRAVLNSGHRAGGPAVAIQERGRTRRFSVFGPLALALPDIMTGLPRTLNSRSITISMQRSVRELRRLDVTQPDPALDIAYGQILLWSRELQQLDSDPKMPAGARNRFSDNWRPLLSIADNLDWGERAREAMTTFMHEFQDADIKITLLADIRRVFDAAAADRLFSSDLLGALYELDADWGEFHGIRGDGSAHKLKSSELASMLRDLGIRPRPIWPLNRTVKSKSARGYRRQQFEAAWRAYCSETVTPSQASKIKGLLRVAGDTP
jgi:hypothetical protein